MKTVYGNQICAPSSTNHNSILKRCGDMFMCFRHCLHCGVGGDSAGHGDCTTLHGHSSGDTLFHASLAYFEVESNCSIRGLSTGLVNIAIRGGYALREATPTVQQSISATIMVGFHIAFQLIPDVSCVRHCGVLQ